MKISELYRKIEEFESSLSPSQRERSSCRKGCSRCCFVDLSVFPVEAQNIRSWFAGLTEDEKLELTSLWMHPSENGACVFLRNDACTIYAARPLICRSQGLAFRFSGEGKTFLDICPLNEALLDDIKENEILNLDLLNLMLSHFERLDAGGEARERMNLSRLMQEFLGEVK